MEPISIRPPTAADIPAIARLIADYDQAINGESSYEQELESVSDEFRALGASLATDAWVAHDEAGQIIGYERVTELEQSVASLDGYVAQAAAGQGIGSALLGHALARCAAHRAAHATPTRAHGFLDSIDADGRALLLDHGFQITRHFYRMQIALETAPEPPVWPTGVTVRAFVPGQDDAVTHELMETTFADHWGHQRRSLEVWRADLIEQETFDPALWFLAQRGGELIGAALCFQRPDMGWVRGLGVLPAARQRGLGTALLQHAFGAFYQRGTQLVGLGVDAANLTGATRIYERAGMQITRRYDRFDRAVG